MHVFLASHGRADIKVLDIPTHVQVTRRRYGAVDDQLGSVQVRRGGADIARKVDEVADHG